MGIRETVLGVKPAFIGGKVNVPELIEKTQDIAGKNNIPLNWEKLFGSVDLCECDECNSVLSPAAYFVELRDPAAARFRVR